MVLKVEFALVAGTSAEMGKALSVGSVKNSTVTPR